MSRNIRIQNIYNNLKQVGGEFVEGFRNDYGVGREDTARMMHLMRKKQGLQEEAPRFTSMTSSHPLTFRTREAIGKASPEGIAARAEMDMGMMSTRPQRWGQRVGTLAADLTQDSTRSFWWLMNAAQAAAQVGTEAAMVAANPKLYGKSPVIKKGVKRKVEKDDKGKFRIVKESYERPLLVSDKEDALAMGVANYTDDNQITPRRGYSTAGKGANRYYEKRNFQPGHVAALGIPTGIAINTGLGLMTPFGGAEGYKAAMPSEEDPTKTENVLGEIALKYIMGRTGQLLPYNEFVKVRPDVSPQEYAAYKGFKYDKNEDWNPLDGDLTILAGALKATSDGIHGPEIQFLGRGLPVTTGVVPYAGALAGGIAGVRSSRPIVGGFGGGLGGLAAGQVVGNLLEQERRRRNSSEEVV